MAAMNQTDYILGVYSEEDKAIETAILQILNRRVELSPHELLVAVNEDRPVPFPINKIRQAIWRLADRSEIVLTDDRKFRIQ